MKTQKYSVFYLIKGKAGKYNWKLVHEVGPMFGKNYMVENLLPSHVTLKSPFETNRIKKVEELLNEFVKKQKPSKIDINGFGNFRKFVAFLKITFSKQALKTQKQLLKELEKMGIKSHRFDKNFKPHATISYGNTNKSFERIWSYLKKLDKPKFKIKLDNITIMKKGRKYWKVYKEFKIK